ncbi:low temperature requirement protein A [Micromonospora sp. IBSANI012]|uniref:low temperature requirement protein A n=1 Tax=Micromonospora sp. IBSANI012 TaxID=3457761 RepID=UPI004059A198
MPGRCWAGPSPRPLIHSALPCRRYTRTWSWSPASSRSPSATKVVIEHPFGHTQPAWGAVILGGPALFLVGRAILEYEVFGRVSRDRVVGILVLAATSPATIFLPPVLVAAAAALVLAGIAVSDAAHARRRPPEPPSPPG